MDRLIDILSLPQEILEITLLLLDPKDIASCARTCRDLRTIIYCPTSDYLWRALFLQLFDDPRARGEGEDCPTQVAWRRAVQDRIGARQYARSVCKTPEAAVESCYLNVLFDILAESVGDNSCRDLTAANSKNVAFVKELLTDRSTRTVLVGSHTKFANRPDDNVQTRLHVYYGLTEEDLSDARTRGRARETVYDMKYYCMHNSWGPFLRNKTGRRRPDWAQLEAIMIVVGTNARDRQGSWRILPEDLPKTGLDYARPYTCLNNAKVEGDWAGITGRWYRIVTYMDYNDLYDWNWGPGGPANLDDMDEAVKLMALDLKIVSIGTPPPDAALDPASYAAATSPASSSSASSYNPSAPSSPIAPSSPMSDDASDDQSDSSYFPPEPTTMNLHPGGFNMVSSPRDVVSNSKFPTIFFVGTSSSASLDPPVTQLRGRVDLAEDGTVLWRLTSRFSGHSWVSEGVQVGGIQSQFGVLAIWSELHHEDEGPAGPSWIWKSRSSA